MSDSSIKFFKDKIKCAIYQIEKLGMRISTHSYYVFVHNGMWTQDGTDLIHPLGFLIINQKLLRDKTRVHAAARRLSVPPVLISAFNSGLCGSMIVPTKPKELSFFMYGRKIRENNSGNKRSRRL